MTFHHTPTTLRGWSKSSSTHSTITDSLSSGSSTSFSDCTGLPVGWRGRDKGQRSHRGSTHHTTAMHSSVSAMHMDIWGRPHAFFYVLLVIKTFDLALMWAITGLLFMATSCRSHNAPCLLLTTSCLQNWLPLATPLQLDNGLPPKLKAGDRSSLR